MLKQNHYKTIIISDVHLGTNTSKAKELVRFLKTNTCDKLILNGDIIDGWRLKKSGKWKKKHTRFFKVLVKMMGEFNTEVIYIRGNHDDFLDNMMPFTIGNLSIRKDYIHKSFGKNYYVVHGDIFDNITTNLRWLAKLGDIGYTFLLWMNKVYNNRRVKRGLPYYSLSQEIKQRVKTAVSYISSFEQELVNLAKQKNCQGVICGHIHHPDIREYGNITYYNSGDWIESLTALVEHYNGNWEILYYNNLIKEEITPLSNQLKNIEFVIPKLPQIKLA
ncbi:MAG: UDP-2,3-diacylglucosamine hydrolase [Bacteroidetes bacterium GWC2_33_15]|nr:MAG: UDP-2,3-diacylglucosamine hydrolase [Bacteroidetes bacterium GWA2_33_15]OFX51858.1 MAG: UDP-2,3-diacylglucosamine hydrolase [Bacteroidetes bacterium GWC2_33_15]OFX63426.1 MAG: UDP-2,3-diacylglucosamine hydrolase [Bacteroidetes bacterium GWB2_32_14]OFX67226.1 MAG: UDP-2,3-diacylglucosamine hydrolase [Bacteroidetes bacterium GWD2_33_33]HAN17047.1 UDP-2,3-diacylglucosamine hydrolase [Bacteroidales bacterium]